MGEPAGVGTEITLTAWLHLRKSDCSFFLLGDPAHVAALALAASAPVPITIIARLERDQSRCIIEQQPLVAKRARGAASCAPLNEDDAANDARNESDRG